MPSLDESLTPIGYTISTNGSSSLVIREDGSLWGWGRNFHGELGDGTTERRDAPIHIMDNVVSASVDWGGAWAIRTDGSLWTWRGARRPMHFLDDVMYFDGRIALKSDGSLWDQAHIMDDVVAFSASHTHTMAIKADGSLWGWGQNFNGQIGDGTRIGRDSPVHIMDDVIAVSAGGFHTAAITSNGVLWTWGNNSTGQLGDGTVTRIGYDWSVLEDNTRLYPIKIMGDVIAVSASDAPAYGDSGNTLVIKSDGSLWGWGFGINSGFIPYHGNTWGWQNPTPGKMLDDAVKIVRNYENAVAISSDGNLWDLTNGVTWISDEVMSTSLSWSYVLTLQEDGSLWGWERNAYSIPGERMVTEWHNPVHIMDGVMRP